MKHRPPLTLVTLLVAGLLALVGVVAGPVSPLAGAQAGGPTEDPAPAAAGWLARQLVDGERLEVEFDGVRYPDHGLTADAVLAFDAAGVAQDFATNATSWLAQPGSTAAYLGDGDTESYAGPHAKLALIAQAQGGDPNDFGGVDLLAGLQALQAPSGRFSDRSAFGDFSNVITQSLAIVSLVRAGADIVPAADYLVASQCADGGFPLNFEQAECTSEADASAMAIQAMLAAGSDDVAAQGLDYLEQVQASDGSFEAGGPEGANANSTGLAAQALRVGGRDGSADRAVGYLLALQVGCHEPAEQHGAVAYDGTGFRQDTAVRATAQAVPGIVGTGLLEIGNGGASSGDPVLDCGTTTTTPTTTTPTTPTTTTTTTTAPATSTSTSTSTSTTTSAPAPPGGGSTGPGELANTGTWVGQAIVVGLILLAAGTAAMLLARRRTGDSGRQL